MQICVTLEQWAAHHLTKVPRTEPVSQCQVCNLVPTLNNLAKRHQYIEVQQTQEWTRPEQ